MRTLLDGDVTSGLKRQVYGRRGRHHVEGYPVMLCDDGQLVGSYLIGCVTIGNDSVCSYQNYFYSPVLQNKRKKLSKRFELCYAMQDRIINMTTIHLLSHGRSYCLLKIPHIDLESQLLA